MSIDTPISAASPGCSGCTGISQLSQSLPARATMLCLASPASARRTSPLASIACTLLPISVPGGTIDARPSWATKTPSRSHAHRATLIALHSACTSW